MEDALELYEDLKANVRHDGRFHSIRQLVQPDDPLVRDIARRLVQADDFIAAVQDFVHAFTTYRPETGDYWRTPSETLAREAGDCDDSAILTCSLLRNYLPPEDVFCAVGLWIGIPDSGGHMWVITRGDGDGDNDRIIETTASSRRPLRGSYVLMAIFNDAYAFATPRGLGEFDLKPDTVRAGVTV